MGGAVAICIKGTLMQATMTSDNFTGLAGTPKNEKLIIIFRIAYNLPYTRVVQGGLWHDSRMKKITNHGSRILIFHFAESRK